MVRILSSLLLIVSLVLPLVVNAEPTGHIHDYRGMPVTMVDSSALCEDSQCDKQSVTMCCEMLVGYCSITMLQPGTASALSTASQSKAVWPVGAFSFNDLLLAFDPPPPRV